ncbi:membrane protein [Catellatospora sp. IY07-71]|uniref:zf-HC2 domain-containing protein n=1 Tax=Catellatospora sp. IY07-71 TaxID=2728827 RepID=UPI001BB375EA|nr:zf-HC2 domain-containing protein [Catellatospora sp. IY07-71]BCJ74799.1 membrane protein [Catellatospora sp. IY07-71]
MDCEQVRELLSARLDGEDDPAGRAPVDAHVAGCAGCAQWLDRAESVTRLARTAAALPVPPLHPDALAAVLAAAPAPAQPRRRREVARLLRVLLLAVGLGQLLLGVAQISSLAAADRHAHPAVGSVSSGHLWHESAAWNVAIGAALAWLAWRRTRPAALLPVMTAFVVMLTLLTANDALAGRVEGARIMSHGLVLAGYGLLLALNLRRFRGEEPPGVRRRPPSAWSLRGGDDGDGPLAPVYPFPVRVAVTQTPVRVGGAGHGRVDAMLRRAA